jgi:hypothetical protein
LRQPMISMDHDPSTNGSGASKPGDATDVFADLSALRLTPDEAGQIGSEEALVHVSVRKPSNNEFVRVNPDPTMSLSTSVFIDSEREVYLVAPNARNVLVAGVKAMLLLATVNQRGVFFIWPLALGDGTGRRNAWHDTAREAAELAKREWIKLVSDMPSGQYRVYRAKGELPNPVFPEKSLEELLRIAFRGRVIDGEDHPVVRQALGLIP